ncbi:MAG: hypothetical protein R6V40_03940 [Candidatus Moraniibacteriota bacterium]
MIDVIAEVKKIVFYDEEKNRWFAITVPINSAPESITFTGRPETWNGVKPPPIKSLVILKEITKTKKGLRANFAEFA